MKKYFWQIAAALVIAILFLWINRLDDQHRAMADYINQLEERIGDMEELIEDTNYLNVQAWKVQDEINEGFMLYAGVPVYGERGEITP